MGTPKVAILLDERGEMTAVEVNGQQLHVLGCTLHQKPREPQQVTLTFYADVELRRADPADDT